MEFDKTRSAQKPFFFSKGKLYFSTTLERRVFFYLTVVMATLGLLVRYGILS